MKKINENKELIKELNVLQALVKMGLLNFDNLKEKITELGVKYNMTIVLRNHDITSNKRTIEIF